MDDDDKKYLDSLDLQEPPKEGKPNLKEYKYTISFINGSPGLVIRGDHSIEMENTIRAILPVYKRFREAVEIGRQNAATQTQPSAVAPVCKYHNKPMTWKEGVSKKTNKPYAFWTCGEKTADGGWCDYKPL